MASLREAVSSPVSMDQNQTGGQYQNQNANFALMELEKGLRSTKAGEQCEAIVNVPALLRKHPYPILVNSAFLKLGDVFRSGSNFMKLCVLKAIQSSQKHLEKIFNVDEFCRRFFVVIHSNDPIARAVTLRVFGNISSIISEKKNIHHCIQNSLDSHDIVEVEAAIFATKCFAEQSNTFASSIWQKVADMIQGLSTPVEMKLKLLPVLKFMYHDVNTANQVVTLFEKLLSSYPAYEFVSTILNTSTQLSLSTLINTSQQVDLLLRYLTDDPRKSIKLIAVRNLLTFAKNVAHLWKEEHIESLLNCVNASYYEQIKEKILKVILIIAADVNAVSLFNQQALSVLEDLTADMNVSVSTLALKSRVLVTCNSDDSFESVSELEGDLEMLVALSASEDSLPSLQRCLDAAKIILSKTVDVQSTLVAFIIECLETFKSDHILEVLHMLVSVATVKYEVCSNHVDTLTKFFENRVHTIDTKKDKDILVALFTLIMQSSANKNISEKIKLQERLLHLVSVLNATENYWTVFKMARQASRLVFPLFASKSFNLLASKVSSENLYFWLKALSDFQRGEASLMSNVESVADLQELLMSAHDHYQQGLTNLKAAVTTDYPLYFQFKFARLRSDMLRAYSQLLTCCSSFKLNPPPSLARASSLATGQEVHQLSRLAVQFQNCAMLFNNVAIGYQNLFKSSFNCDPVSLCTIQILQECNQLVSYAIEALITQRSGERISPECSTGFSHRRTNQFLQSLSTINLSILKTIQDIDQETKSQSLSHRIYSVVRGLHYCMPSNSSCWPSEAKWKELQRNLNGTLHRLNKSMYNECIQQGDNAFKISKAGYGICMQYHDCSKEYCIGSSTTWNIPEYSVEVETVNDVQVVMRFGNTHNIGVSVKTSGHSFQYGKGHHSYLDVQF